MYKKLFCGDIKITYLKMLKGSVFFFAQQLFQSLEMVLPIDGGGGKRTVIKN